MNTSIPIIDIKALVDDKPEKNIVAKQIGDACREFGFFYVIGHRVDDELQRRIVRIHRQFFAQPLAEKEKLRMSEASGVYRGYFSVGDERFAAQPDLKEGIYFVPETSAKNSYPNIPEFRETVEAYIDSLTDLGHKIARGISLSLNLDENYFADRYTGSPKVSIRVLNYPPLEAVKNKSEKYLWGIGEHTDYGFLTILKQDSTGGLQIKCKSQWIEATPLEGSFICNIGDMLDRMTGGLYRSTPHRVRCPQSEYRVSIPFFFGPNLNAVVKPIEGIDYEINDDKDSRWDKTSVHLFSGTYGEYIVKKMNIAFSNKINSH